MANSNFTMRKQLSKYTVFKIYGSCSAKLTRIHNSMRSHSNSSSCKSFFDTSCSKQADKFQSCIQLQTVSTVWIKQLCQNEALARNFEGSNMASSSSQIHNSAAVIFGAVAHSTTPREILNILCVSLFCGCWTKLFKTQIFRKRTLGDRLFAHFNNNGC